MPELSLGEVIDYAADIRWPHNLIDGRWDAKIGCEEVQEPAGYARAKRVVVLAVWEFILLR
jgi:hypothetical protein